MAKYCPCFVLLALMILCLYMVYSDLVLYFSIYSFFGWMLEKVYRSVKQMAFVSPGFLYGCFLPIYGTSAVSSILLEKNIDALSLPLQIIIYGILVTVIEYMTGLFMERVFGVRFWDYSKNKFNIRGIVCLQFFVAWSFLAILLIKYIHPVVERSVDKLHEPLVPVLSSIMFIYFIIDFVFSTVYFRRFARDTEVAG